MWRVGLRRSGNGVIHDKDKGTNRFNNTSPAIKQMAELIVKEANA